MECLATRLNLLNFKEKLQNTLPHGKSSPEKGGYADMRICNGKDLPTHSNMLSIDGSGWIRCGKDLPTHCNMLSIDGSEYADT